MTSVFLEKKEKECSIWVCSLAALPEMIRRVHPGSLISLTSPGDPISTPSSFSAKEHLILEMHDISIERSGLLPPKEEHFLMVLDFLKAWDQRKPLLLHCFAAVSRSTALAYALACALRPDRTEESLAEDLRSLASSATPNPRLVAAADRILGRFGRMEVAIAKIGRGCWAAEGRPFLWLL